MKAARTIAILLLALAAVGCATGAADAGRYSFTVVTQHEHIFTDGEVAIGPLLVAGGAVVLQPGTQVQGLVLALAGQVHIDGFVDGDVLAVGADVTLGDEAVITGDLQQAGGTVQRAPGATVRGEVSADADPAAVLGGADQERSTAGWLLWVVLSSALMAGVAWIATRTAPRLTGRVQRAGTEYPLVAGALGTLALVMAPALIVSMVFTLLLLPLALVLLGMLGFVLAYGLVGLGRGFGEAAASRMAWEWSPPVRASVGTGALVVALHLVSVVPVLGALSFALVGVVATGAVLVTGFGSRAYQPPDDVGDIPPAGPAPAPISHLEVAAPSPRSQTSDLHEHPRRRR